MANRQERRAKAAQDRHRLPVSRACGECSACCTVLGVPELEKAAGEACRHSGKECAIYPGRPGSCRMYRCLWLQGLFRDEDRPDRLGVIAGTSERDGALGPAGGVLVLREVTEGAWERADAFLARLPTSVPIYVKLRNGQRWVREINPLILAARQTSEEPAPGV